MDSITYITIGLGGLCVVLAYFLFRLWRKMKQGEEVSLARKEVDELLMKNVRAFILLIDTDFRVIQTNYYTLTQTGQPVKPKRVGELLKCTNALDAGQCGGHLDCVNCPVRKSINQVFHQKENFKDLEAAMTIYTDDRQSTLDCELMVSGAYLELKGKGHLLLTLYDVTQLKQIQKDLVIARERAEQADELKSAFLANMSHEIRTPLNAIVGFSELLVMANEQEKEKYMYIIRENNDLLVQLINDILDVSKIEAGTLDFNYTNLDISQLLRDLCEIFHRKMQDDLPVELSCQLPFETCVIYTEKNRLMQVLSNLINNALKFTDQGSVCFGYEKRGEEIYFYVQDSGMGISPENQAKLFQRFAKLNKLKPGTGLGLFISRVIVEKLGGKIGVESELGKGSLFWFTVPQTAKVENSSKETSLMM